jgi:hypothetical protein
MKFKLKQTRGEEDSNEMRDGRDEYCSGECMWSNSMDALDEQQHYHQAQSNALQDEDTKSIIRYASEEDLSTLEADTGSDDSSDEEDEEEDVEEAEEEPSTTESTDRDSTEASTSNVLLCIDISSGQRRSITGGVHQEKRKKIEG